MPQVHCKVCGCSTQLICTTLDAHGSVKELSHHRCLNCGLVFVANEFTPKELSEAYDTQGDYQSYYREIREENLAKFRFAAGAVTALTAGDLNKRILDIGCGNGDFLHELRRQGYQCLAGHEIPGTNLDHLRHMGITISQSVAWSEIHSGDFDLITLLDVAEHVVNPLELFSQCYRMLKSGGYLYIHTPVVTKLDRVMHTLARTRLLGKIGRVWQVGRTSIFHLQNYTDKSFQIALSKAGFIDVHIERRNELSWPVERYVRIYVCEKQHFPLGLVPILTPLAYPFIATDLFNSNKGIVTARKQ